MSQSAAGVFARARVFFFSFFSVPHLHAFCSVGVVCCVGWCEETDVNLGVERAILLIVDSCAKCCRTFNGGSGHGVFLSRHVDT